MLIGVLCCGSTDQNFLEFILVGGAAQANANTPGFTVQTERENFKKMRSEMRTLVKSDLQASRKPNILLLHVESLRADMLTEERMPRVAGSVTIIGRLGGGTHIEFQVPLLHSSRIAWN